MWNTANRKILKKMGILDHLICFLRNLYAGQEPEVGTGHRTTAWFKIGTGVCRDCILSSCLFNLYSEYIIQNAGLDESQFGSNATGRKINSLRYVDDTTRLTENEEELKSDLIKEKEESEKIGLKFNIQKTKIMASSLLISWQKKKKKKMKSWRQWPILFSWTPKPLWMVTATMKFKKRHMLLGRKSMTKLDSILKSRDITLLTKVHRVKAMVFPVVMYGGKSWI